MNGDPEKSPEARRLAILERMRAQPRPPSEAPTLRAVFPNPGAGLRQALDAALVLMERLVGTTSYIEDWRVIRSEAEYKANTGLNPLKSKKEWIEHELSSSANGDDIFNLSILAFSRQIKQKDPRFYSASLTISGGALSGALPTVFLGCALTNPDHNMTLQEYVQVIEAIVDWRTPTYVGVGSPHYGIYDRVFDHRAWDGWLGWVPAPVHQSEVPNHAIAKPLGPGTLIAAQESNVIGRLDEDKARANAVEIALVEHGLLPTLAALQGDR